MRDLLTLCLATAVLAGCAAVHGRGLNDADNTHLVPANAVLVGPARIVRVQELVASPQLRALPVIAGRRMVPPGERCAAPTGRPGSGRRRTASSRRSRSTTTCPAPCSRSGARRCTSPRSCSSPANG